MPEDDLSQAGQRPEPPSFDFDEEAIATLLDAFVEKQTGPQAKRVSRPPDPGDAGANAAQRTVFDHRSRVRDLPLVGDSTDARKRRIDFAEALAERAAGSARARLLTCAAELREQLGDIAGAVRSYEQALAADARDVIVLRRLRRHAIRRADWPAAIAALQQEAALALAPTERAAALRMLAMILLHELGEPAAAEQAAAQAVALRAGDFAACMLVASACLARHELERAAAALVSAAECWPVRSDQKPVLLHASKLLEHAGDPAAAKRLYQRVLEHDPDSLKAHLGLARSALALGDVGSAVGELKTAAQGARGALSTALTRAAAAMAQAAGDPAAAVAMLTGARDVASRWTLVEAAILSDDLPRAIAALEERALDDTEDIRIVERARAARFAAEARLREALSAETHGSDEEQSPALGPYLRAVRELWPSEESANERRHSPPAVSPDEASEGARMVCADEAARIGDLGAFVEALRQEWREAPEPLQAGASLAVGEAAARLGKSERLRALLDAEASLPSDPLVRRALWLADEDRQRQGARWAAEAEEGPDAAFAWMMLARFQSGEQGLDHACRAALQCEPDYWPAQWELEAHGSSGEVRGQAARDQSVLDSTDARAHRLRASLWSGSTARSIEDAEAALNWSHPDPLLTEHLIQLHGHSTEEAGDLMRTAASQQDDPSLLPRAAAALGDAGLAAKAARTWREAESAVPADPLIHAHRREAELEAGEFARLAESEMQRAKQAGNEAEQLGALCAMAEVDRLARHDMQSARLSLQSIAELRPGHLPTVRALEGDALAERDTERIRAAARLLLDALAPGSADRIARRRLLVELLRTDPDILQADLDRMLRRIDEPLDADPGLARMVLGAAYARADSGSSVRALASLERSMTDELERDALALERARVLHDFGDTPLALDALEHAPRHPLVIEERARLLEAAKRWEEAAVAYEEAADRARSPRRAASLWRNAAVILEERIADAARATEAWVAASACDVTYLDVYRRLASQYRSRGENDELASLIEARIEAGADTPTLVGLLLDQADHRHSRGDLDGLVETLQECLELDPHNFIALGKLVDAHRAREDWQGAAEALIRIARLRRSNEEQAWTFSQLGEVYHEHLGDSERAEASLRKALALAPDNVQTLDRLASVLSFAGKPREAARLFDQLVRMTGDAEQRRDYRIRLCAAVEQAGQRREAERLLEALRADHPTEADVILALADFYERQGDGQAEAMHLNRAVNDLRAALDADPGDEASWITLVRVLRRRHGPGPASCAASAAVAVGHSASLFEGDVEAHGRALGQPTLPLPQAVDSILAPFGLPPTLRRLFTLCEHSFDKVLPFDAAAWRVRKPSAEHRPLIEEAGAVAAALGISEPRLKVTYLAPVACIPTSGDPLTIIVGGHLHEMTTPEERAFLFARALQIAANHLAPALRAGPGQLDAALRALLQDRKADGGHGFGSTAVSESELRNKLLRAVPRRWRDEVESLVLELRGSASFSERAVASAISQLGDRVALTLTGDVPSAVRALLKMAGRDAAGEKRSRLDAIRAMPEAWALIQFAISDAHFEGRAQAGVDR